MNVKQGTRGVFNILLRCLTGNNRKYQDNSAAAQGVRVG